MISLEISTILTLSDLTLSDLTNSSYEFFNLFIILPLILPPVKSSSIKSLLSYSLILLLVLESTLYDNKSLSFSLDFIFCSLIFCSFSCLKIV